MASEDQNENKTTAADFMQMSAIPVSLSYAWLPGVKMTFPCKMIASETEKAARQKFYAQDEAAQETGKHAYFVEMLSSILTAAPQGIPAFDDYMLPGGDGHGETLKDAVSMFFGEPSPMNIKICEDAVNLYATISQPIEFFR